MTRIAQRLRHQGGQAMLEYSLIAATVVMAFAGAAALTPSGFWTNNLDDVRNKDYLVLACDPDCIAAAKSINDRIEYR